LEETVSLLLGKNHELGGLEPDLVGEEGEQAFGGAVLERGDDHSNCKEYLAGTDPKNLQSGFTVKTFTLAAEV
jgi:hypothetical protein